MSLPSADSGADQRDGGRSVLVLNAGALGSLVANGLGPTFQRERGIAVRNESGPSVGLANALRDKSKAADVYMSADAQVNATLMGAANGNLVQWYVTFARNEVVLVYSAKGRYRADFEKVAAGKVPWYEVLQRPGVRLVRGDPNFDPLAYYTLFVVELSESHYGVPGLKRRILGDNVNPAQHSGLSFSSIENGEVDALFMYRSFALDRQFPFLVLPGAINLSDVSHAESYARVSFTTSQGQTFRGGPIHFSATILSNEVNAGDAAEFVAYVLSPDGQRLVEEYHFLPGDLLLGGDPASVPPGLRSSVPRPDSV